MRLGSARPTVPTIRARASWSDQRSNDGAPIGQAFLRLRGPLTEGVSDPRAALPSRETIGPTRSGSARRVL